MNASAMRVLQDAEADIRTRQIALAEAVRVTNRAIEEGASLDPQRLEALLKKVSVPAALRVFYRFQWVLAANVAIAFSCGAIAGSFELISHSLQWISQMRPPASMAVVFGYLPLFGIIILGFATLVYALKGSTLRRRR